MTIRERLLTAYLRRPIYVVLIFVLTLLGAAILFAIWDDDRRPIPTVDELQELNGVLAGVNRGVRASPSFTLQTADGRERYLTNVFSPEFRTALDQPVTIWVQKRWLRYHIFQFHQEERVLIDYAEVASSILASRDDPKDIWFGMALLFSPPVFLLREMCWLRVPSSNFSVKRRVAIGAGNLLTFLGVLIFALSLAIPESWFLLALPLVTGIGITEYAWSNYRGGVSTPLGVVFLLLAVMILSALITADLFNNGLFTIVVASFFYVLPAIIGFWLLRKGHRGHQSHMLTQHH